MAPEAGKLDPGNLLKDLEQAAAKSEWTPLFSDDFARSSVGEDWQIVNGLARISDGWMRVWTAGGSDVYAVVRRPFPENLKIEFDARFPADVPMPSDLSCFLAGSEESCDAEGYCLAFASDNNTCARLQRQSVDIRIDPTAVAETARTYHVSAELVDGRLALAVDGRPLLSYFDMLPLSGPGHDHLGLATFKQGAEFAHVRVSTHAVPSRTGVFAVGDAYCRDGLHDMAIEKYRQVAAAHPDQLLGLLAQCKVALALMAAQRWSEADAQLRGLATPSRGTDLECLVSLWHARALGMMGKLDDALRAFGRVQTSAKDPGVIDEVAVTCGILSEDLRSDGRWLEAGRCAKFLFENTKTPLIETVHMFNRYGNRLHDAALFEEEYQAVTKTGLVTAARGNDPSLLTGAKLRRIRAAVYTHRPDVAAQVIDELERQAREAGDRDLEISLVAHRAELDLADSRYEEALARVASFAGTTEEDQGLRDTEWGNTLADIRATALLLLGRIDEALDDLDAGRISDSYVDLRMCLAAELWKRGRKPAAAACLEKFSKISIPKSIRRVYQKLLALSSSALRGEALVESLQEFVDTDLQPVHQPRGMFYAGLTSWSAGNDGAAMISWSDARNMAVDVSPIWHFTGYFQGRVEH